MENTQTAPSPEDLKIAEDAKKDESRGTPKNKGKRSLRQWLASRFDIYAAEGLVFAGAWYRLLAFIIDFLLSLSLAIAVLTAFELAIPVGMQIINTVAKNSVAMLLIQLAYFIIFERSAWKATPGKRLLKLRVTDKRGHRLGWGRAVVRNILKLTVPLSMGVTFFSIFFTSKCQTMYDRPAGTLVLRKTQECFLPKFVPPAISKHHWAIVVALSVVFSFSALRAAKLVAEPRLDIITLAIIVDQSVKDFSKAQRFIEESLRKDSKTPASISPDLFVKSSAKRYLYVPANGSLTMIFEKDKLKGRGLVMTPTIDAQTKEIVWACAALNLPAELTPRNCAPSKLN